MELWAIGLVGGLFGWAFGFNTGRRDRPTVPIEAAAAYQAGWSAAREQALRVARAHDFNQLDRILTEMEAKG